MSRRFALLLAACSAAALVAAGFSWDYGFVASVGSYLFERAVN